MRGTRLTVYLSKLIMEEIKIEAERLNRPYSWVVQRAWEFGKNQLRNVPVPKKVEDVVMGEVDDDDDE